MSPSLPILFLKNRSVPTDAYETYFSARTLSTGHQPSPRFVPVLHHTHTNLPTLASLLVSFPASGTSGIVITSQRAVEALGAALSSLAAAPALLASTTVYVVGSATRRAVAALGFDAGHVLGEECGNGAALSEYILARHRAGEDLLALVGETRSDVVAARLAQAGVRLAELVVYETRVAEAFEGEFSSAVHAAAGSAAKWVVVFSPQGARVARSVVERAGADGTYWAAIGPTTERCLVEMGRSPEVVARKPSPEGLWQGIDEFMKRHHADTTLPR